MKELIKAGLEVKDGKVRKSDVAKAIEILASEELTKDAFLDGIKPFIERIKALHEELEAFAEKGNSIKGEFVSVDFDGDEVGNHDSLGEALAHTCELDLVASALNNFIAMQQQRDENEDEEDED